jgi:hypothetical protein
MILIRLLPLEQADSAKKRGLEKGIVGVNFGKNKDRVLGGGGASPPSLFIK